MAPTCTEQSARRQKVRTLLLHPGCLSIGHALNEAPIPAMSQKSLAPSTFKPARNASSGVYNLNLCNMPPTSPPSPPSPPSSTPSSSPPLQAPHPQHFSPSAPPHHPSTPSSKPAQTSSSSIQSAPFSPIPMLPSCSAMHSAGSSQPVNLFQDYTAVWF